MAGYSPAILYEFRLVFLLDVLDNHRRGATSTIANSSATNFSIVLL